MKTVLALAFLCCAILAHSQPTPTNSAASIQLAWNASPSSTNAAYGPLSYTVWMGTNSGVYFTNFNAGSNFFQNVSNLARGTTYYFAATVSDTNGQTSGYSAEATFYSLAIPQPPSGMRVMTITP